MLHSNEISTVPDKVFSDLYSLQVRTSDFLRVVFRIPLSPQSCPVLSFIRKFPAEHKLNILHINIVLL